VGVLRDIPGLVIASPSRPDDAASMLATCAASALVDGWTEIGDETQVFPFASVGLMPQDIKYRGEKTRVVIGRKNIVREFVTIHRGTQGGGGLTSIGDRNLFMAYVHVAHDCRIGSHTVLANCVQLAGHVRVDDHAILGGFTGVHQFCRIGAHSFTGVGTVVLQDVPPFVTASDDSARPYGINAEGLKRRGFSPEEIAGLKKAYRTLYRSGLGLEEAKRELEAQAAGCAPVRELLDFITRSKRGFIR